MREEMCRIGFEYFKYIKPYRTRFYNLGLDIDDANIRVYYAHIAHMDFYIGNELLFSEDISPEVDIKELLLEYFRIWG